MQVLFGFDGASAPKYGRIFGGVGWTSAPGVNDFGFQRLGQPVKTSTKKLVGGQFSHIFPKFGEMMIHFLTESYFSDGLVKNHPTRK